MQIEWIEVVGFFGVTLVGGWVIDLCFDDVVYMLVIVCIDEGVSGVGSVYSDDWLVWVVVDVLVLLVLGEHVFESERVFEKLH